MYTPQSRSAVSLGDPKEPRDLLYKTSPSYKTQRSPLIHPIVSKMAPSDRLTQVNEHLNYPAGLLAGQVAIITGAGQGIGAEAARLFANEGAKVVVADIDSSTRPIITR